MRLPQYSGAVSGPPLCALPLAPWDRAAAAVGRPLTSRRLATWSSLWILARCVLRSRDTSVRFRFRGAWQFETLTTALAAAPEQDSVAAFKWALHNLYRAGDALHILHVLPDTGSSPASGQLYYGAGDTEEEASQVLQQAGAFIQSEFVGLAATKGVEVNVVLVKDSKHKHVGWAVCAKAEELDAAPLVLATHHKSYFAEMLLGSVSKFCAANCKQPVLLVHPDHSQVAW